MGPPGAVGPWVCAGVATWIELPWLDRVGFWMAVPFLAILVLTLVVVLPYMWWLGRAKPPT